MSAGPSRALASLNLQAQGEHFARSNLAPPLRGHETESKLCYFTGFWVSKTCCEHLCRQGRLRPSLRRELFDFAAQVALAYSKSLLS